MSCAIPSKSQDVKIAEKLSDGSYIVAIAGQEFRALSPDKIRDLQKQRLDLEAEQKINSELRSQVKEALLQRDLAEAQKNIEKQKADSFEADFKRSQEDAKRNFSLYMSERDLRVEAQTFVPHGTKTKVDKILSFFDQPATISFFKIGLPLLQTWRCQ